jgi:molybdenum cofactor biosynthesis enzyme MoaA
MTNLHFCENCNKLRLTCDGKLRPCLGSYLEFDIMGPLRAGASDQQLKQFFSMWLSESRGNMIFEITTSRIAK